MKLSVLLTSALFAGCILAQGEPVICPMPSPLPVIPAGANPATFPIPRVEWLIRAQGNISKAKTVTSPIRLIFDGDSITDGWQGGGRTIWAERYEKLGAFDFGISGDRTEHVLWRLAQGQVEGINPKLIAIMIGTNNLGNCTGEQIADGVKAVVADYQKRCPKAVILLQAIFPRAEQPTNPARAKIKAINQIISKLGDGKKVIFTDFGDKFLNPDGTMSPEIMPDFLHPSLKGYKIWADAIQPIIDQYFAAK